MARKKYPVEDIIKHLRTVEIKLSRGQSVEMDTKRPHSSLNYRPPNPEAFKPSLTQLAIYNLSM